MYVQSAEPPGLSNAPDGPSIGVTLSQQQFIDRYDLEVTAADPSAVDRLDALVDAYLRMSPDLPGVLAAAPESHSAALSEIAAGCLFIQAHTSTDHQRAAAFVQSLEARHSDDPGVLNERETQHLAALARLVAGDVEGACDVWERLLGRWPTDLLALRLSHFTLFNRGRLTDMVRLVDQSIDAWEGRPYRSYLDGMKAFALEELGQYRDAERLARAAVDVDRSDLWSIHAVAHVLEMEARAADGLAWFEEREDDLVGAFGRHLWWHHAIIHLRTGDHQRLLDLYDQRIQPGEARDGLSLTNAIDSLARLEFSGVNVGDRWPALAAPAQHRLGHHDHPFNDCHYAYALARSGEGQACERLLQGMRSWSDRPTTAGRVLTVVGLDTARAMAALGSGDSTTAADLFSRSRAERWKLGGSHAQRRLFELAESSARAGEVSRSR
ncbi:MAG: tetratricopeptide repeat protein [Actinomycetota bacterium]|nr:tetratricopeptide repeat protein [Actinomycetota bacterium]